MDAVLKPCPVCNSEAELKEAHYFESELPYSYVHCTNEACTLNHNAAHFSSSKSEAKNDEDAISAWNKREQIPAHH